MSMPGAPQDDQRNAITMALMGIANPPGKGQLPQQPGFGPGMMPPKNVSQGMTAMGNAMGSMGPQPPGPPMPLAPPMPQAGPPMQGAPPPQGMPIGAGMPPGGGMPASPPPPPMPQGPEGIY
jgi:hypothetical protein